MPFCADVFKRTLQLKVIIRYSLLINKFASCTVILNFFMAIIHHYAMIIYVLIEE